MKKISLTNTEPESLNKVMNKRLVRILAWIIGIVILTAVGIFIFVTLFP